MSTKYIGSSVASLRCDSNHPCRNTVTKFIAEVSQRSLLMVVTSFAISSLVTKGDKGIIFRAKVYDFRAAHFIAILATLNHSHLLNLAIVRAVPYSVNPSKATPTDHGFTFNARIIAGDGFLYFCNDIVHGKGPRPQPWLRWFRLIS